MTKKNEIHLNYENKGTTIYPLGHDGVTQGQRSEKLSANGTLPPSDFLHQARSRHEQTTARVGIPAQVHGLQKKKKKKIDPGLDVVHYMDSEMKNACVLFKWLCISSSIHVHVPVNLTLMEESLYFNYLRKLKKKVV